MKNHQMKNTRFFILGEHGSYIIKDVTKNRYVADGIQTMAMATKMLKIFESAWSDDQHEEVDAAVVAALVSSLTEAVSLYGKPGGPWNVPFDPGGWIWRAKEALKKAGINMDASANLFEAEDCENCYKGVSCGNPFCPNPESESMGHS